MEELDGVKIKWPIVIVAYVPNPNVRAPCKYENIEIFDLESGMSIRNIFSDTIRTLDIQKNLLFTFNAMWEIEDQDPTDEFIVWNFDQLLDKSVSTNKVTHRKIDAKNFNPLWNNASELCCFVVGSEILTIVKKNSENDDETMTSEGPFLMKRSFWP